MKIIDYIKIRNVVIALLCVFLFACTNNKKPKAEKLESVASEVDSAKYLTKSGKLFIVHINSSKGASINEVQIEMQEFEKVNDRYNLGAIDPVKKVFLADLDNNGFEEIYLITESVGSGSYSTVYGLASNKDKSATPIYVRPISELQKESAGMFEGFMGHNKFEIEDGKLMNSFPVYLEGDSNSNPNGGERKIQYQLIAGEAGWILETFIVI